MLPNSKVLAFTISELFRENQRGWGGGGGVKSPSSLSPRLGLRNIMQDKPNNKVNQIC